MTRTQKNALTTLSTLGGEFTFNFRFGYAVCGDKSVTVTPSVFEKLVGLGAVVATRPGAYAVKAS